MADTDLPLDRDVLRSLEETLGSLPDQRMLRLLGRALGEDQATQADLADQLGVSRVRVQQLQRQATDLLEAVISTTLKAGLQGTLTLREWLLPTPALAVRLEDLLSARPALGEPVEELGVPAHLVLVRLAGLGEAEGWIWVPPYKKALAETRDRLRSYANTFGVVAGAEASRVLSETVFDPADRFESALQSPISVEFRPGEVEPIEPGSLEPGSAKEEWLVRCGGTVFADHVLLDASSISDYAAAVLWVEGTPLAVAELGERFDDSKKWGERSVRNALTRDPRISRASRTQWGLAEWAGESYTTIRDKINQVVEREGGEVALKDLSEELTRTYGVSAKSVATYSASPPFQSSGGIVRKVPAEKTGPAETELASEHQSSQPSQGELTRPLQAEHNRISQGGLDHGSQDEGVDRSRSQYRPRVLSRDGDGWAYRIRITHDHLRGSGIMVAASVARRLGLKPGEQRKYRSDGGNQLLSWRGAQPMIGTIRRLLEVQGVTVGEDALLIFGDNGSFELMRAPQ